MTGMLYVQEVLYSELIQEDSLKRMMIDEKTQKDILKTMVFDEVPQGIDFPYIAIGEATERENPNFNAISDVTHIIDIFDDSKGNKNIFTIAENVIKTFNNCNKDNYKGYQVVFKKIEEEKVEKIVLEATTLRHYEITANFTIVKS